LNWCEFSVLRHYCKHLEGNGLNFGIKPVVLAFCVLCAGCLPAQQRAADRQQSAADKLIAEGHYLRAQPLVQEALGRNPKDVHSLAQESILRWAFYQENEFLAEAQKVAAAADNSAEAHAQLANALGEKLASGSAGMMARMSAARGFRKEAERTLELNPGNADALQDMAEFYWHAPKFAGGDKEKARQMVEQLMRVDSVRAYALRAEFAADATDTSARKSAVEAIWQQAVSARPDSYRARTGLAESYLAEGGDKLRLAEMEAKKAVALNASRIGGYRLLADVYATEGRWSDLDAVLRQSRAQVPDDLSPMYEAAQSILVTNAARQLGRAETYLRDYLQQPTEGQEPTLGAAHWRLGLVLEKEGKKSDAVRELQTAVNMDPSLDGAKKDLKRLR
jgi:hypothetical protein